MTAEAINKTQEKKPTHKPNKITFSSLSSSSSSSSSRFADLGLHKSRQQSIWGSSLFGFNKI
jgi:hypothetical protein